MKLFMRIFIAAILFLIVGFKLKDPVADKKEAKEAFVLLNQIRTKPERFCTKFPFLSEYKKMHSLKWNDTLAKVAERKAVDMATHNYQGHVDAGGYGMNYYINKEGYSLDSAWLKKPKANFFESCNAGGLTGT